MILNDEAEEILENLWSETVEHGKSSCDASLLRHANALADLQKKGCVEVAGNRIILTHRGHDEARDCVRRHRLAERLLVDLLDIKKDRAHDPGCIMEHVLRKGLDENVCTLLGHPKHCPHGRPIPDGKCCRESRAHIGRLIVPLTELEPGSGGEVAYLQAQDRESLQKLVAMGILPGVEVSLMRKSPAFVFEAGRTQFAMDFSLASRILVRISQNNRIECKKTRRL